MILEPRKIKSDTVSSVSPSTRRRLKGSPLRSPAEGEASNPITSWEIDGETEETVSDFILGGSKITADGDCSHEIKRCLLFGRNPSLLSGVLGTGLPGEETSPQRVSGT